MENKIIAFYDEKKNAFTDSKIISIFANVEHKSVKRIINNHKKDFLTFGKIDSLNIKEYQVKEFKENFHVILPISNKEFSDFKSRNYLTGRPENFYLLNEEQATLLITYLKNTKQVREFKKELVKEFYRLKKENYKS